MALSKIDSIEKNNNYPHQSLTKSIEISESVDVTISDSVIIGSSFSSDDIRKIQTGLDESDSDSSIIRRQSAVSIKKCCNVNIRYCYTKNIYNSFELIDVENLECKRNISHYVISDMFHCQGIVNAKIRNNYRGKVLAYQIKGNNCDSKKVHSDFVQLMCPEGQAVPPSPCKNVIVQYNQDLSASCSGIGGNKPIIRAIIDAMCGESLLPLVSSDISPNHGVGIQGFFVRSEEFDKTGNDVYRHKNITIRKNKVLNTQHNPYTVSSCDGIVVESNVCVVGINNNTSSVENAAGCADVEGITNGIKIVNCDDFKEDKNVYLANNQNLDLPTVIV